MSRWCTDVRGVAVGLLTGVVVTMAAGQAAAPGRQPQPQPQPQPGPRYQISVMSIERNGVGSDEIFILDHQTQRVYRRRAPMEGSDPTVEGLIGR